MYAMDAVRACASKCGKSLYRVSLDMGKSRQYVNSVITQGSTPKADTLARMLDVCGYELVALPKGDRPKTGIKID